MTAARCAVRRARRPPRARDRGAISLELAIVAPVVMTLLFTIIHACLWYHARNVALAAAQHGVEVARVRDASLADGTAETRDFLARAGKSIHGTRVSGSFGQTVRIEVHGTVPSFIPGLHLTVNQHAEAAKERITEPQ